MYFNRLLKIILALALVLALAGFACAANGQKKKLKVLASTFPVYQITRNITEGYAGVDVELMIPATLGCPHDYSLTPGDMKKIAAADVLVINGLGLEEFLGAPVDRANPTIKIIDSSSGVENALPEEGGHGGVNAHIFTSPTISAQMAQRIAYGLADADVRGARTFFDNARKYGERMKALAQKVSVTSRKLAFNRVVTGHDAFAYLAQDAGLVVVAVVGEHTSGGMGAAEIRAVVAKIKAEKAAAVFFEPSYPSGVATVIARETGIPVASLDPGASGPENAPLEWFDWTMEKNLQTLEMTLGVK